MGGTCGNRRVSRRFLAATVVALLTGLFISESALAQLPLGSPSSTAAPVAAPVTQAAAPVTQAAAPVTQAAAPVTQAAAPVTQAAAPVTQAAAPVTQAAAPVTQAAAPVTQAAAPVTQAAAPVVAQAAAPIAQAATPIVAAAQPLVEPVTAPLRAATAPAVDASAPLSDFTTSALRANTSAQPAAAQGPDETSTQKSLEEFAEPASTVRSDTPAPTTSSSTKVSVDGAERPASSGPAVRDPGQPTLALRPSEPWGTNLAAPPGRAGTTHSAKPAAPRGAPLPTVPSGPVAFLAAVFAAFASSGALLILVATIVAAFFLAIPNLGRWLRPIADICRPPGFVTQLELPG